ncbi:MBL fold metallo-hydrolase [Fodinisporobacter ferrooxydans]|uniref:MBL fold metallo-hydrolase n=1 Tax=Fodinisporobacter ferrooxydans TaxID=2901836 RepID=A0ABY4CFX8_9BACL|nr:MBL fold metallo-hydrolase [Alicyclobacillaceae bacterium MYW30-H2]
MFQVRVLGEHGPYPAPGGATTGFLIQTDEGNVLLDCGSGVFAELTKYVKIEELDAVLVTHHHADHVSDIPVLRYAVMIAQNRKLLRQKLPIYANQEPQHLFASLAFEPYVTTHKLSSASNVQLIGASFTFANTIHAISCLAVRVEYKGNVFVFSADSGPCAALEQLAKDADVFICEASWLEKDKGSAEIGHLTTKEAARIAKRADVKQLALTHFFPDYDRSVIQKEAEEAYGSAVHLCKQGEIISIS